MTTVKTRSFKSGNSVAARLPKAIAFRPGTELLVERTGEFITMRPLVTADAERERLLAFLDAMDRLPGPTTVEQRDVEELPERSGL